MNTIREIVKINKQELDRGIAGTCASWHSQFANSAWCYIGNLDHQLTEGDIICILSQYGEVEDVHLVREEDTGKSRGFAFIKFEDTRSCILAVDNFCGVIILGRFLRVDHVEQYRLPKKLQELQHDFPEKQEPLTTSFDDPNDTGYAYKGSELENKYSVHRGMDLFALTPHVEGKKDASNKSERRRIKIQKKSKRKKKQRRRRIEKEERRRRRKGKGEKQDEKRSKKRVSDNHDNHDGQIPRKQYQEY